MHSGEVGTFARYVFSLSLGVLATLGSIIVLFSRTSTPPAQAGRNRGDQLSHWKNPQLLYRRATNNTKIWSKRHLHWLHWTELSTFGPSTTQFGSNRNETRMKMNQCPDAYLYSKAGDREFRSAPQLCASICPTSKSLPKKTRPGILECNLPGRGRGIFFTA